MTWNQCIRLLLIPLILTSVGCASGLTLVAPRVEAVTYGEKSVGDRINVVYKLDEEKGTYTLTRQPLCKEQIEEIKTSRKRPRGLILALCEVPLYGFGIVDYMVAKLYSGLSDEEVSRAVIDSGDVIPCGDVEKAADEEVVLQFPDSEQTRHMLTDTEAHLPIEELIQQKAKDLQINVFVKRDGNILYIRTIDQTFTF